jgi:xanthine phosphoribosyltransferase
MQSFTFCKGDCMRLLKEKIISDGKTLGNSIIKVDSFLNHQLDVNILNEIGKEFYNRFKDEKITKILTIEASGIAIATLTALHFGVPVVFAKKTKSLNLDEKVYNQKVFSYTKDTYYDIKVSKEYLNKDDNILIIDDFLARGQAALGLYNLVKESKGTVKGIGIVIEKGFQNGGNLIRKEGIRLESLAVVEKIEKGKILFQKNGG